MHNAQTRGLLFPVKRRKRVPQIAFILGQADLPSVVSDVDGLRRCAFLQAGSLSGEGRGPDRNLQAAARRCEAVEGCQHKIMQHRLEGDCWIVRQRIAQGQRAMCGQLGDEPIRQRFNRVVVFLLDGFCRRATDGDDRTLDHAIGLWSDAGLFVSPPLVLGIGDLGHFILTPHVAAVDRQ